MKSLLLTSFLLFSLFRFAICQCLTSEAFNWGDLKESTGDISIDNDIVSEMQRIEDLFGVKAEVLFSDSKAINAYATPRNNKGKDGTIIINNGLLNFIRGKHDFMLGTVLAHEYGHLLQNKYGYNQGVHFPSGRITNQQIELFADYLSGVYLMLRGGELMSKYPAEQAPEIVPEVMKIYHEFGESFGDDNFGSIDHHGTAKERASATLAFFKDSYRSLNYVSSHRAKTTQDKFYYSIYANGRWWKIGEYAYVPGLKRIANNDL